jgi:cytochrome c
MHLPTSLAVAALAALSLAAPMARAQATADPAKQRAFGQHLARECVSCHRIDGTDTGIPSILGMPADAFTETMGYYRSGARDHQVMVSVAKSLDEAEIAALAAYFESLPKPPRRTAPTTPAKK